MNPADAERWSNAMPTMIRTALAEMPNSSEELPQADMGRQYRLTGVGLGAVLAAITFSKKVPGKWKYVTGGTAGASAAGGIYAGKQADEAVEAIGYALPEMKNALMAYADGLEKDPALRQQLAAYLAQNVSDEDAKGPNAPQIVTGYSLQFAASSPYMDVQSIGQRVTAEMEARRGKTGMTP